MTDFTPTPEAVEATQSSFTRWCLDHSGDRDILRGGIEAAIATFVEAEGQGPIFLQNRLAQVGAERDRLAARVAELEDEVNAANQNAAAYEGERSQAESRLQRATEALRELRLEVLDMIGTPYRYRGGDPPSEAAIEFGERLKGLRDRLSLTALAGEDDAVQGS